MKMNMFHFTPIDGFIYFIKPIFTLFLVGLCNQLLTPSTLNFLHKELLHFLVTPYITPKNPLICLSNLGLLGTA